MSITIAIPFYNAEHYLLDAIRSVFAQTYEDWELILMDDGSTDRSLEIARSVKDSRVRVFSDGKNRKLATRLNEINRLARYEFIARMDADDLMSPDRLRIQHALLSEQPDIDLVSCGLFSVRNDLSLVGVRGEDCRDYAFKELLEKRKSFVHAALMARKSWYMRNTYDENASTVEDIDLWLRASKKGDFKAMMVSEPLYLYREEGNVTAEKMLKSYQLERTVLSRHIESPFTRAKYLAKSYAKTAIIYALSRAGGIGFLQKSRNESRPNELLIAEYQSILDTIKHVSVPGLV